jgi:hypothetical protein
MATQAIPPQWRLLGQDPRVFRTALCRGGCFLLPNREKPSPEVLITTKKMHCFITRKNQKEYGPDVK